MKKKHLLRKLFFSTLYLSAFTFGGGYVIITLLKQKFVDIYKWIDEDEMLDLVAIAQSSPGAVAVNGAIVVGYKLAGIKGVLISVTGAILPPMLILSILSMGYQAFSENIYVAAALRGMNAGVGAVIVSVVYDMGGKIVKSKDWINILIMGFSFIAVYFCGLNVIVLIVITAVIGFLRTFVRERRKQK